MLFFMVFSDVRWKTSSQPPGPVEKAGDHGEQGTGGTGFAVLHGWLVCVCDIF